MFDFRSQTKIFDTYYRQYGEAYNDAGVYGVIIHESQSTLWKVIGVHHLSGSENAGKHNIYFDVLDREGLRTNIRIHWEWEGMHLNEQPNDVIIDKPDYEPGGNIALHSGQKVICWIADPTTGSVISDKVSGLHINHSDEEQGNTWGHHSFFIVFQKVTDIPDPRPSDVFGSIRIILNKKQLNELPTDVDGNISFLFDVK